MSTHSHDPELRVEAPRRDPRVDLTAALTSVGLDADGWGPVPDRFESPRHASRWLDTCAQTVIGHEMKEPSGVREVGLNPSPEHRKAWTAACLEAASLWLDSVYGEAHETDSVHALRHWDALSLFAVLMPDPWKRIACLTALGTVGALLRDERHGDPLRRCRAAAEREVSGGSFPGLFWGNANWSGHVSFSDPDASGPEPLMLHWNGAYSLLWGMVGSAEAPPEGPQVAVPVEEVSDLQLATDLLMRPLGQRSAPGATETADAEGRSVAGAAGGDARLSRLMEKWSHTDFTLPRSGPASRFVLRKALELLALRGREDLGVFRHPFAADLAGVDAFPGLVAIAEFSPSTSTGVEELDRSRDVADLQWVCENLWGMTRGVRPE